MNRDILNYKLHFLTLALLFSYTYIHTMLTGVYVDTPFNEMVNFSTRLPYGQRLLVPLLVHYLAYVLPIEISLLFFLMEWLFVSLLYFALIQLLKREFEPRLAQLLSWLFILLLPLMTVINYRLTTDGAAAFFFPCDTVSLFFVVAGFWFCLNARWGLFMPLLFLATLNRESSLVLVLLIPALYWPRREWVFKPLLLAFGVYCLTRLLILTYLDDASGTVVEWYFRNSNYSHFEMNLLWLFNEQNIFLFVFCLLGLSLAWFVFYDFIPLRYQSLRYVCLLYFLGLLFVGNFMEARIFGEIVALLYLPICLAIRNWLIDFIPAEGVAQNWGYYIKRYSVLAVLIIVFLLRSPILFLLCSWRNIY